MTVLNANHSISVVIPCFGDLEYLQRAIESIEGQTLLPLEVILVNDAAGSRAASVISQLASRRWNFIIKVITLYKNIGAGSARNVGWNGATGKYIAFLDADDAWHPKKLEYQFQFMEEHPDYGLSGHEHLLINEKSIEHNATLGSSYRQVKLLDILLRNPFVTPSIMVRRSILLRFHDLQRHSEDYRLWLEIAFSGVKVAKLSDPLAYIYKPLIGTSGLSSNLLRMEEGELRAYAAISFSKPKYYPLILFLAPYSIVKFFRRVLIVVMRSISHQ